MFLELCCNLCVQGLKHRCFVLAGGLFHLLDADENGVVSYSEMMQQIKSPAELQLILTMLDELHLCAAVDHDQPSSHAQEGCLRVTVLHPRPLQQGVDEVARDVLPTHALCPGRTTRASVPTPICRASKAGLTIAVHCGLEPTAVAAVADSADHQQTR